VWGGNDLACSDCSGTPNGDSELDDCGVCGGEGDMSCVEGCDGNYANDGSHAVNDECGVCGGDNSTCADCENVPNGNAIIGCSGECRGGNTGLTPYELCGCFEENADNYFCDIEGTSGCIGNGINCREECTIELGAGIYIASNPFTDDLNPNYGAVFNENCEYWGCVDENASNYGDEIPDNPLTIGIDESEPPATNCEDDSLDSCCDYLFIYFSCDGVVNNSIDIYITNSIEVGGFQFDIENQTIISGSNGLASDNGFQVIGGGQTVIGFTTADVTIPIGTNQLLTSLTLFGYNDGDVLTFSNLGFSDNSGNALSFISGNCYSE